MNSLAQELKIPINPSNPSSEYEDSLTSKLNSILHSSDEVKVEPSEIFKPSYEQTEQQEPISSSEASVPPKPNKRKSAGSFASLGTVVRHETPNRNNRKISLNFSSRRERKNSAAEKEIWQFFKRVVKKNPEFKEVVKRDKDLEEFFLKKFQEFEEMLKDSIGKNKLSLKEEIRGKNKEKLKKTEDLQNKLIESDLEKVKKSFKKFEESCKFRLRRLVDATLKKYQNLKMIEDCKEEFEYKNTKKKQKMTIIENIRNYYDDKIKIFKEHLEERKMSKAVVDYEHKIVFSEARRERMRERRIEHEKSLDMIKKKVQKMKVDLEDEEQLIQKKIIKLYKHSARSLKKF